MQVCNILHNSDIHILWASVTKIMSTHQFTVPLTVISILYTPQFHSERKRKKKPIIADSGQRL